MLTGEIHSCPQLMEYINTIGFLPLLDIGVRGWSAEDAVDEDCRYHPFAEEGLDWPLWQWKGSVLRECGCAYGKFLLKKACFISREWWPDFCNYRRSRYPKWDEGSIEDTIMSVLEAGGNMVSRDLRSACGFNGKGMRGKFDAYITRLQMAGYVVTEDFVYQTDRHGREYGFGLQLLTTAEERFGKHDCITERTPDESKARIVMHLKSVLPEYVSEKEIMKIIG